MANARYNLLSRKKHSPVIVRPVTLKVRDQETHAGLTDKDREALPRCLSIGFPVPKVMPKLKRI